MARTNATNFTGGLQFPYATAAADLFKKEDVQVLAQAVDQHDHSSGKGLLLSASSIPAGFITSAMIADGTITSADIADGTIQSVDLASGAVTQRRFAGGVAVSPATSSTTFANVPDLTVSLTTLGTTDLMVWAAMAIYNSALASFSQLAVSLDGAAEVGNMIASPTVTGGNGLLVLSTVWAFTTVSAAAHTVNARWSVGSGTMTNNGTERYLMVMEMRR